MVKIISPFGTGDAGAALFNAARHLFGGGSPASASDAYAADRDYEQQMRNAETENLMRRVANGGAQALGADPIAQAMMIGSGYDPSKFADMALLGGATQFGAADPRTQALQVGSGQSYDNTAAAVGAKLAEQVRQHNIESTDRRYGTDQQRLTEMLKWGTPSANQQLVTGETTRHNTVAEQQAAHDQFFKPTPVIGPNGATTFANQGELVGSSNSPIISDAERKGTLAGQNFDNLATLDPNQQEYLGARVKPNEGQGTPKNYIIPGANGRPQTIITYDGVTDARTGAPLPPGGYVGTIQGGASDVGLTNSVNTDLQSATIATRKLKYLTGEAMKLTADPTLFGAQGYARTLGQEVAAGVGGLAQTFGQGGTGAYMLDAARQDLANNGLAGLLPELYDPNLPKVDTIWGLLTYQVASTLAGQNGRGVSDTDVKNAREITGDPKSVFSSAQMMQAKLQQVMQIADGFDNINREALGNKAPVAPGAATGAPSPEQPNRTSTGAQWRIVK